MPITTWEDGIFGRIPQTEWLNIGRTVTRPNDPVDGLFGDEKTDNITAKWQSIADIYNIPTMAYFHGFDTEANTTYRIPIDVHSIEKGLIKVKLNQSERLRALLRTGVQNSALMEAVMNDGINLADQVVTRTKVMKNEILATGKATIKENNLDIPIDYGVPAGQISLTIDLTGDIPSQINEIVTTARTNGTILNGFITSSKILSDMRNNEAVQKVINGNIGIGAIVKNADFRDYLSSEYGLTDLRTNDLTYNIFTGYGADGRPILTSKRYYPEDKITFFATNPAGRLGVGLWGDPPEAYNIIRSLAGNISGSSVSPYVWLMQWATEDPTETWTKASTLFMPVLYNPNSLYIATRSDS